jgi:hypothetical protein
MAKRIKIIDTFTNEWYRGKAGSVYVVQGETESGYYVNEFGNPKIVQAVDCILVEDGTVSEGDNVNQPNHYTQSKFETIEVIEEITAGYSDGFVAYSVGNALKYLARAPFKHGDGGLEDCKKAAKYLEFAIKRIEAKQPAK